MARNRTAGMLQVTDNSVTAINQMAAQIRNELDTLRGLRGPRTVHDRLGVADPSDGGDAVNLSALLARETLFHVTLVSMGMNGLAVIAPGRTYTEVAPTLRTRINFATPRAIEVRLIVWGAGTEAGADKGVALYSFDGDRLCEVTWESQSEGARVGAYTPISLNADSGVLLSAKGSSATENLILRTVHLECRQQASVP
jgi:hypothetical protein